MPNLIYSAPKCVKGQQMGINGPERGQNHKIDNNSTTYVNCKSKNFLTLKTNWYKHFRMH